MYESINMTRTEINEAVTKFLAGGGKITKLPDGPDHRFQPYDIKVSPTDPKVDLTVTETPTTKQQLSYFEKNSL